MYDKAITLASKMHRGQKYGDMPYLYHLLGVESIIMTVFKGDSVTRTVAILHDIIEDTPVTYQELLQEFGEEIADAVLALTRTDDQEYEEYLEVVMSDPVALVVKKADALFNLEHSVADGNHKRIKKYIKALQRLS